MIKIQGLEYYGDSSHNDHSKDFESSDLYIFSENADPDDSHDSVSTADHSGTTHSAEIAKRSQDTCYSGLFFQAPISSDAVDSVNPVPAADRSRFTKTSQFAEQAFGVCSRLLVQTSDFADAFYPEHSVPATDHPGAADAPESADDHDSEVPDVWDRDSYSFSEYKRRAVIEEQSSAILHSNALSHDSSCREFEDSKDDGDRLVLRPNAQYDAHEVDQSNYISRIYGYLSRKLCLGFASKDCFRAQPVSKLYSRLYSRDEQSSIGPCISDCRKVLSCIHSFASMSVDRSFDYIARKFAVFSLYESACGSRLNYRTFYVLKLCRRYFDNVCSVFSCPVLYHRIRLERGIAR
jgi:hypothetical protein